MGGRSQGYNVTLAHTRDPWYLAHVCSPPFPPAMRVELESAPASSRWRGFFYAISADKKKTPAEARVSSGRNRE